MRFENWLPHLHNSPFSILNFEWGEVIMTKCRSHDRLGSNAGVDSTVYHLTITAATGKQISQLSLTQSAITLPTNQWLKGIYFATLSTLKRCYM